LWMIGGRRVDHEAGEIKAAQQQSAPAIQA
jgi:hypothetical protein